MKVDIRKTDIIIMICILVLLAIIIAICFYRTRPTEKELFLEKVKTVYRGSIDRFIKETDRNKETATFYIGRVNGKNCHMDVFEEDKIGAEVDFFVSIEPKGNIVDFVINNNKYQYFHRGDFKIDDIHLDDIEEINEENKIEYSCTGVFN